VLLSARCSSAGALPAYWRETRIAPVCFLSRSWKSTPGILETANACGRSAQALKRSTTLLGVAGRLCGRPDFAHLGRQELIGLFSDYHFDISKITALGYAPHIDARAGLQSEIRRAGYPDARPQGHGIARARLRGCRRNKIGPFRVIER
jgi:hypothetical protein